MLEFVDYIEQLNSRMRELRDSSALPRSAVTLPDRFDRIVAAMLQLAREQALAVQAAGGRLVEVVIPGTDELRDLARWSESRLDLLTGLSRAGMVGGEWERPVKMLAEVFEAVVAQLAGDEDCVDPGDR